MVEDSKTSPSTTNSLLSPRPWLWRIELLENKCSSALSCNNDSQRNKKARKKSSYECSLEKLEKSGQAPIVDDPRHLPLIDGEAAVIPAPAIQAPTPTTKPPENERASDENDSEKTSASSANRAWAPNERSK
jgi:hypothetical protein